MDFVGHLVVAHHCFAELVALVVDHLPHLPGVHSVSFLFGPPPFGGEQLQQVYSPPLPLL